MYENRLLGHLPSGTFLRVLDTEMGSTALPDVDDGDGDEESQEPSSD